MIKNLILAAAISFCITYFLQGYLYIKGQYGTKIIPLTTPLASLMSQKELIRKYSRNRAILGQNWINSGEGISICIKENNTYKIYHCYFIGADETGFKGLILIKDVGDLLEIDLEKVVSCALWVPIEQNLVNNEEFKGIINRGCYES